MTRQSPLEAKLGTQVYSKHKALCDYRERGYRWHRCAMLKSIREGTDFIWYDLGAHYPEEQPITVNRRKRIQTYFRDFVWPEMMAVIWHPRNIAHFADWGEPD